MEPITEFIDLVDSARCNLIFKSVVDGLSYQETATCNLKSASAGDQLLFSDGALVASTLNGLASDMLTLVDLAIANAIDVSAVDYIVLSSEAASPTKDASDVLTLVDSATVSQSKTVTSTLVLTDSATCVLENAVSASDGLTLKDTAGAYLSNPWKEVAPPEVASYYELISSVNSLDKVRLPSPKFGNSNTVTYKRINRESRGNALIIEGYPEWKPERLQRFEFDYMCPGQAHKLFEFMKRHVGLPIYADGVLVLLNKPDAELSQIGRQNRTIILDMLLCEP